MGKPEQLRAVRAMLRRWKKDEARLEKLCGGPVIVEDLTTEGEILRNIGTAIAYAERFLTPPAASDDG